MNQLKLMVDRRNPRAPLEFAVRVTETRTRFGIEESLVTPEAGHGTRWVQSTSLSPLRTPMFVDEGPRDEFDPEGPGPGKTAEQVREQWVKDCAEIKQARTALEFPNQIVPENPPAIQPQKTPKLTLK